MIINTQSGQKRNLQIDFPENSIFFFSNKKKLKSFKSHFEVQFYESSITKLSTSIYYEQS